MHGALSQTWALRSRNGCGGGARAYLTSLGHAACISDETPPLNHQKKKKLNLGRPLCLLTDRTMEPAAVVLFLKI